MEKAYVAPEELISRFRSKKDLYSLLTIDKQLFLPSYKETSLFFIRHLMKKEKLAIDTNELVIFNVPKYPELSVEKLWAFVQACPELMMYFPDLDPGKLPERSFIMGILSTLRGEEMKELIKNARENRSLVNKVDNDELVCMSTDVRNDIFEILPHKTTPGRANFLLKQGVKFKRKKANPRKYNANLELLKREENSDEEEKNMN